MKMVNWLNLKIAPLALMIGQLIYGPKLGLNEISLDQSAPDLGIKKLEDKMIKRTT